MTEKIKFYEPENILTFEFGDYKEYQIRWKDKIYKIDIEKLIKLLAKGDQEC